MAVAREETFGPLCPVFRFETEVEVIEAANNTEYGLAAYLLPPTPPVSVALYEKMMQLAQEMRF